MAKGVKTGGRRPGSRNKLTRDVQAFVDQIFKRIDPIDKLESLLASESEKVQAGVMIRLLEYRYGKPKESIELTGSITYTEALTKAKERLRAHRDSTS
jgi:predicted nucleotidyltransferase